MKNNEHIAALLRNATGKILVISHISPDGDTLGSALALYWALIHLGKDAELYCQDAVPALYGFLPGAARVKNTGLADDYALAVAVDCASLDRLGDAGEAFQAAAANVCIDHHKSNPLFGQYNLVRTDTAAVAEVLTDFFIDEGFPITADMADCLYTGLLTDSGQFSFDSTSADTLRAGAQLLERGARLADINNRVFRTRSLGRTRLIGRGLGKLRMEAGGKIALILLTRQDMADCGADDGDSENLVNYALEIDGVDAGVLLREEADGTVKCSLRSSGAFDAAGIAVKFGGGGHAKAAGFTLDGPGNAAAETVLAALRGHWVVA
ncbi:MAG: DHH family phosphoesterase [Eubacteriales bacterium]|nr:DHH family phosphoesterase [Eubacteriales bacterium]